VVHIETVDLSPRGITLPANFVGMVSAQPYLSLSAVEPFQCIPSAKADQLSFVTKTLDVSRLANHGAEKTHFTVFPEYSVPGLDGIGLIQDALSDNRWPTGTIVIGGTDALAKEQFASLCDTPGTHLDAERNGPGQIPDDAWVNCKITWIKGADGTVERWLQPK
jgi:hypothetical protein